MLFFFQVFSWSSCHITQLLHLVMFVTLWNVDRHMWNYHTFQWLNGIHSHPRYKKCCLFALFPEESELFCWRVTMCVVFHQCVSSAQADCMVFKPGRVLAIWKSHSHTNRDPLYGLWLCKSGFVVDSVEADCICFLQNVLLSPDCGVFSTTVQNPLACSTDKC